MIAKEWADKFRDLAKEMEQDVGIAKVTIEKVTSCDYSDELLPMAKEYFRVEFTHTYGLMDGIRFMTLLTALTN